MKKYKIVDRKAPRYRMAKFRQNVVVTKVYERFCTDNPDIKISWAKFKSISEAINEEFVQYVINNREGVKLPAAMGRIWMGLFKPLQRELNKHYAWNTGEHTTYFSFETNGLQGKILWNFDNCSYKVKNNIFFSFTGHRSFKNKASKAFLTRPQIYCRNIRGEHIEEDKKNKLLENELSSNNIADNKAGDQPGEGASQVS